MTGKGLENRLSGVRLIILDVDGVLTDGKVVVDGEGGESLRFDIQDGYGIVRAMREGLLFAIISGRDAAAVDTRAAQLGIEIVHQGQRDKRQAFQDVLRETAVELEHIAYIGDDLNDLPIMAQVGVVCAVANARPQVKEAADVVTSARGGDGAVREFLDLVMAAREG
ncbi:MAG: HAD hydrolase family protein [bacterium]